MANKGKSREIRTSVGLKMSTKEKLDANRAPGQCYDGFICQLVDLWEKNAASKKGSARKSGS